MCSGSRELQESDKVETGFLTTVCCCVITVLTAREACRRVPCGRSRGADIEVGKHAKDIKDTPKDNVRLNLSNMLAKRLEDEERKKKRLIRRCNTSLPSVTLHTFPLPSRQTHVSNPSRVEETRPLKTERSAEDRPLSAYLL